MGFWARFQRVIVISTSLTHGVFRRFGSEDRQVKVVQSKLSNSQELRDVELAST